MITQGARTIDKIAVYDIATKFCFWLWWWGGGMDDYVTTRKQNLACFTYDPIYARTHSGETTSDLKISSLNHSATGAANHL